MGTNLFIGTRNNGIYFSSDNGTNWTQKNNGITNNYIITITAFGSNLLAGTFGGGMFLSSDNGESWTAINDGLCNPYIRCIEIGNDKIYIGTYLTGIYYGGLYYSNLSDFGITGVDDSPFENQINIYPNPATSRLNLYIDNSLTYNNSNISINSIFGNIITLPTPSVNGNQMQYDITTLPQGIYCICIFNGNTFERTKFVKIGN